MRPARPKITALLLGMILTALLAGCGGGTKTVSVASAPPPEATATTTTTKPRTSTTTTPATTPTDTTPAPSEHGGTSGPAATTRTATAPAFTHEGTATSGSTAEGLSAAEAVLQAKGYTARASTEYHPDQTLQVLVGTRAGSAEAGGQQAFFFVDGHYIGTDAKQPSASVHVTSQGDTEVTLAYALAGGGQATVRFQLNNGKLVPLSPIPPASSRQ